MSHPTPHPLSQTDAMFFHALAAKSKGRLDELTPLSEGAKTASYLFVSGLIHGINRLYVDRRPPLAPPAVGSPLSVERIEEIKKRANTATVGPWTDVLPRHMILLEDEAEGMAGYKSVAILGNDEDDHISPGCFRHDASFIAHARQDIPDLLAELDYRQQQTRQVLQELLDDEHLFDANDFKAGINHERKLHNKAIRAAAQQLGLTLD